MLGGKFKYIGLACLVGLMAYFYWSFGYIKKTVTYDQIQSMLENEQSFTLIVVKDDCSYCEALEKYTNISRIFHPFNTVYVCEYEGYINYPTELGTISHTPTIYKIKHGKVQKQASGFNTDKNTVYIYDGIHALEDQEQMDFWKFIGS